MDNDHLLGRVEHVMHDVVEHTEEYPVELRRHLQTGRILIASWNEGRNNLTEVDLWDLLEWLRRGPIAGRTSDGFVIPGQG